MQLLSLKLGETIHIGEDVRVTLVQLGWLHVRLGIAAPKEIPVHREEVFLRIQAGEPWPRPSPAGPPASSPGSPEGDEACA